MFMDNFVEKATDATRYFVYDSVNGVLVDRADGQGFMYALSPVAGEYADDEAPTMLMAEFARLRDDLVVKMAGLQLSAVPVVPDRPKLRASMVACLRAWLRAGHEGPPPGWNTLPTGVTPRAET